MTNVFTRVCMCAVLGLACRQGPDPPPDPDGTIDSIDVTTDSRIMPDIPPSTAGRLAIRTASRLDQYVLNRSWLAQAGHCEAAGLVQILVQTAEYGVGLLFPSSPEGSVSMNLPLLPVNDSTLPDESARVVVQIYPEDRAYVLKAIDGAMEIDSVSTRVSGRFTATLVEGTYRDTVLAAGIFESLPVNAVGDEFCRPLMARADSLNLDVNDESMDQP